MKRDTGEWDHIIVGGGSAGCVLADRLSQDGHRKILLIEAGGWDRDPLIHIPLGWGRLLARRAHDWHYDSEPNAGLGGRAVECIRGKVIGGSSSINAMTYARGSKADFDRWAGAYGLRGWDFDEVLPLFIRQETWAGPPSAHRGQAGPLHTRYAGYEDDLLDAYLGAAVAAGHAHNDDLNGERQLGFGRTQVTIKNGRRCSNATAFLRPALGRSNLTIVTAAHARRIVLDDRRATAVEYVRHGEVCTAAASGDIVVCAGAINSPKLLMHSGIGDPRILEHSNIPVALPLPGVGKNLQDHVSIAVALRRSRPGPFVRHMRADKVAAAMAQAYLSGTGWATHLPSGITGFANARDDDGAPDLQFLFAAAPFGARPYLRPFVKPFDDGFSLRVAVLHPRSRGRIVVDGNDPQAAPVIQQNLLSDTRDLEALREGLMQVRRIMARRPLADYIETALSPCAMADGVEDMNRFIRAGAMTVHHPCGTCRMGADHDPDAVLDDELRVRGIDNLRVADASAMPDLVSGNINATVSMIAERAADLMRAH